MRIGYVILQTLFLCFYYVFSEKGLSTENDELKVLPGASITETTINGQTSTISEDQPERSNISDVAELESKNNGSVDNTNETIPVQDGITAISLTERSGGRRLGSSRYKNGRQQVSINDLTLSDNVPRHGALLHKNLIKFDTKSADNNDKDDTNEDAILDTSDNSFKKKRRISTSSATPSVQIVILVIGAVLGCVLLTGFIRWRVRGRLNAGKKNGNLGNYEDSICEMDTIYECECEEGPGTESDISDEEEGLRFNEINSHRFDTPMSLMSQTHSRFVRTQSPKIGKDLGIFRGSKRHSSRNKRGNKYRYLRHQRKRLENMYVQKLETIPMENSVPAIEDHRSTNNANSHTDHADKNGNKEATNGQQPLPRLQQPLLLRQASPPSQRGVMSSLLNTWRSLSFNRDWVGKMWQEQHNIRRISDVLRGLSSTRSSDSERSSRESLSSDTIGGMDVDRQPNRFSVIAEVELSGQELNPPVSRDTAHNINETGMDVDLVSAENAASHVEDQVDHTLTVGANMSPSSSASSELDDANGAAANPTTFIAASAFTPERNRCPNVWSFSDFHDQPPKYESLLVRADGSRSTPVRNSDEHPRYQRRHRRKWLEERHRPNRLVNSTPRCTTDLGHADTRSILTRNLEGSSPFSHIHGRHNQPMLTSSEGDESNSVSMATPTYHTETIVIDEQIPGVSPYINSTSSASASPLVAPFVPQEGVVIEQLSDGAQIVYIPPPTLPCYHNDTPPPYQQ